MHDTFALERFVEAQSANYPRVIEELSLAGATGCGSSFRI